MKSNISIVLIILFLGCKSIEKTHVFFSNKSLSKNLKIDELKNWQNLDLEKDRVSGISLDRAYKEIIKTKKGEEIITAVIDSYIDTNHEDLKNQVWKNENEIPNNNIDDDKNGYVDDINGWNFLGNKNGNCTFNLNIDASRKLRNLLRKGVDTLNFKGIKSDSLEFVEIQKSLKNSKQKNKSKFEDVKYYQLKYIEAFKATKAFFKNKNYSLVQVDSLISKKEREKDTNDEFYYDLYFVRDYLKCNNNKVWIDLLEERAVSELKTTLNNNFSENNIIKDNEADVNDHSYGNNKISLYSNKTWHNTMMSGMIGAERNNNIGINGFGNQIKIMPLVVSAASGNNRDKDIANAIRYAVDNGAKVINMSFGKSTTIYKDWIKESLVYANEKDVLVIVSAGNSNENLDNKFSYPNDYINFDDKSEYIDNLIIVAGTNHTVNDNFLYQYTNYGKKNVDIFAPATDIWCLDPLRIYTLDDGTSFSASLTSGTASLIRSYYPKLSAKQVKEIIMESGISYDIDVNLPGTTDKKVKFSELSKSGKVLNVYNSMLLAEKVSKQGELQKTTSKSKN